MKDTSFITYGNPGTSALSDPDIQSFEDGQRRDLLALSSANARRHPSRERGLAL